MINNFVLKPLAYAVVLSLLSACSAPQNLMAAEKRSKDTVAEAVKIRDDALANASSATVTRTTRSRLAGEEIQLRTNDALPAAFGRAVNFHTQGTQSLSDALDSLSSAIGIPIRTSEISSKSESGTAAPVAPQLPGSSSAMSGDLTLEYSGTLRRLLDEIAARNNASWRYVSRTGTVEFYRFETKTLSVYLPPGSKNVSSSISLSGVSGGSGGGGGGGGGSGTGNVSVSSNLTINPWASVMQGIGSILSEGSASSGPSTGAGGPSTPGGGASAASASSPTSASGSAGRASASPELGLITVTARPQAMERITSYLASINARFAQNVLIDIKVFNLALDTQSSLGFSLDLLYKNLNKYGVSVVGANPLQPASSTPGVLTLSSNNPASRFNGSSAVVQALSQFGNVALQRQGQVLAVNGQPSPFQSVDEIGYLASSATTQAANVGTTTTLTPGSKVVGFTAEFMPLILGDNRILLHYALNISSLTSLNQITSGTSSIQTPSVSSQSLPGQAFVQDGQAIVLFGFDQARDTFDTSLSIGGASRAGRSQRDMVVIVIQLNAGQKNV